MNYVFLIPGLPLVSALSRTANRRSSEKKSGVSSRAVSCCPVSGGGLGLLGFGQKLEEKQLFLFSVYSFFTVPVLTFSSQLVGRFNSKHGPVDSLVVCGDVPPVRGEISADMMIFGVFQGAQADNPTVFLFHVPERNNQHR